jgi:hypothetical protein
MCGPRPVAGEREGEEICGGAWAGPGGKRRSGPILDEQDFFLIYSTKFQTSSKCFDQKVDLPGSKNLKENMTRNNLR